MPDLIASIDVLTETELLRWVEMRWVMPERQDSQYYFSDVDCARVELLCDIRHRLAIEESAVPVILSLLDQVYGLRRELRVVAEAIAAQPEATRAPIVAELVRRHLD